MRRALISAAALVWIAVAAMLLRRGLGFVEACRQAGEVGALGVGLTYGIGLVLGAAKGRLVLAKAALRNRYRIKKLEQPRPWQLFDPGFYPLIGLMMLLGFGLRLVAANGGIPRLIVGGAYLAIGGGLFVGAFAYWLPQYFSPPNPWETEPKGAPSGLAPPKAGILLAQLGTPDAPSPSAVGRFLREFLSDPRVVEVPRPIWFIVLNFFIIPLRKYASAALYRRVFTEEGSPLLCIGRRQAEGLERSLGEDLPVRLGMRYGKPSIRDAIAELRSSGCDRILVLPSYPQYSATTSASIIDAASDEARRYRNLPSLRFAAPFPDDSRYIACLAHKLRAAISEAPESHLVFSYHGIPVQYAQRGDPYPAHCWRSTKALVNELRLAPGSWSLAYQSQFGLDRWLGPSTESVVLALARQGKSVTLLCPGFLVDCLETLDELGHELRKRWKAELPPGATAQFTLVPCLNDDDEWLEALAELARRELGGWLPPNPASLPSQTKVPVEPELREDAADALELAS